MRMYHIHKKGIMDEKWQIGNVISIEEYNDFWKYSANYILPPRSISGNFDYHDLSNIAHKIVAELETAVKEYQILIREIGYENTRVEVNPNLPSRQKCIWLCRKDQLDYWKAQIVKEFDVFEVEVNEKEMFKSRNSLISELSDSYNTVLDKAKEYWKYSSNVENEDDEYLYCGELKIINKIEL